MAMPRKTQAKISKSIPTVASALISEGRGDAAGALGSHGRIRGRAVQDPLGAAAGTGKSAHEPPSLEPETKAKAEQTGASPEVRI